MDGDSTAHRTSRPARFWATPSCSRKESPNDPQESAPRQHLHVGPEGMLLACSFQDQTEEDELDRLEILLGLEASIEDLRQAAIEQYEGAVPTATRPVCAYWASGECDGDRFWIESHPEEQFDQPQGMVCGTHIVEWTSEHGGHEWLLRDVDEMPVYQDDPRPSGLVQIPIEPEEWPA